MRSRIKILIILIVFICGAVVAYLKRDDIFWKTRGNTVEAYSSYLRYFPNGIHAEEAKIKLEAAHFENAKRKKTAWEISESYFENVKREKAVRAFESYLSLYPEGAYAQEAREAIETIYFNAATKDNTVEAYQNFLKSYPEGQFASEAVRRIDTIRFEKLRRDSITTIGYEKFLKEFPESQYRDQVVELIEQHYLRKIKSMKNKTIEWEQDKDDTYLGRTVDPFLDYFKRFPHGGKHSSEVVQLAFDMALKCVGAARKFKHHYGYYERASIYLWIVEKHDPELAQAFSDKIGMPLVFLNPPYSCYESFKGKTYMPSEKSSPYKWRDVFIDAGVWPLMGKITDTIRRITLIENLEMSLPAYRFKCEQQSKEGREHKYIGLYVTNVYEYTVTINGTLSEPSGEEVFTVAASHHQIPAERIRSKYSPWSAAKETASRKFYQNLKARLDKYLKNGS